MPEFRTEVSHSHSKDEATEKLKVFIDKVRERYKDQVSAIDGAWQDNKLDFSLTTFGFTISGGLTVEDEIAVLEGQLHEDDIKLNLLAVVDRRGQLVRPGQLEMDITARMFGRAEGGLDLVGVVGLGFQKQSSFGCHRSHLVARCQPAGNVK